MFSHCHPPSGKIMAIRISRPQGQKTRISKVVDTKSECGREATWYFILAIYTNAGQEWGRVG